MSAVLINVAARNSFYVDQQKLDGLLTLAVILMLTVKLATLTGGNPVFDLCVSNTSFPDQTRRPHQLLWKG